jgi:parallel beta-helix repeat protein
VGNGFQKETSKRKEEQKMKTQKLFVIAAIVCLLVGTLGAQMARAESQLQYTGCLHRAGIIVNVAAGDNPASPCSQFQAEITFPDIDQIDALQEQIDALTGLQDTTIIVECPSDMLQDAIDAAPPNTNILVEGRCNENIRIDSSKQELTLDGQGSARIIAADDIMATVSIFGRGITIQNFLVIRGGSNGIRLSDSASATIENNKIRGASGQGIRVEGNSFATIIGNRVQENGVNGISILETSSADIGTNCTEDDLNVIARNGQSGIALSRNAQASIRGNIIRNNATNGIFVSESSMADTASNIITGNGNDGIDVRLGSIVRLGRKNAPDSCGNNPNSTNPNNLNALIGIDCQNLSSVDGILGSLNGANGATDLRDDNSDCPNCCFTDLQVNP